MRGGRGGKRREEGRRGEKRPQLCLSLSLSIIYRVEKERERE
jgi:hypothetical protein